VYSEAVCVHVLRVAGFFSEADEHSPLSLPTCLCPCARQQHEKNLSKLSAEFAANLELLRDRYGLPCMCASSPSGLLCVHACHMLYPGSEWGLQVLSRARPLRVCVVDMICLNCGCANIGAVVRYEKRLERLRASLELRRKVEIHELEERKNLHVNDLIRSHEASFAEIKKYYNEITKDNLKSIKKFKVWVWPWYCVPVRPSTSRGATCLGRVGEVCVCEG
jgi:hypothetical protein